jgi:hypothetical protein
LYRWIIIIRRGVKEDLKMRGIEAMLLAAFAGLVGLGLWNARQWLPQWSPKVVNSVPANAGKAVEKVTGKPGANKLHAGKRGDARSSGTLDVTRAAETVEVPPWVPVLPTQTDLPVGTSGARIRAKYGEPTARVTEMHAGQLLERYYYFNSERTQLVVATLEGGIVTGAEAYHSDRAVSRSSAKVPIN